MFSNIFYCLGGSANKIRLLVQILQKNNPENSENSENPAKNKIKKTEKIEITTKKNPKLQSHPKTKQLEHLLKLETNSARKF